MSSISSRAAAWAVHAFTASGAVMGLAALHATAAADYRAAFLWMIAATAVDGVDGWLARLARVGEHARGLDGARLDDIVDYVTYVLAPAFLLLRAGLLPPSIAWSTAAAMLLSSAYGFSRTDAKTPDHFFTGFPSYWNVIALYLYLLRLPAAWTLAVLLVFAALTFVPARYLYPSKKGGRGGPRERRRQQARAQQQEGRRHHVRHVVDNVVQALAVQARRAFGDPHEACEPSVDAVHRGGGDHPQERAAVIALRRGADRRQSHDRAAGREGVHRPRRGPRWYAAHPLSHYHGTPGCRSG